MLVTPNIKYTPLTQLIKYFRYMENIDGLSPSGGTKICRYDEIGSRNSFRNYREVIVTCEFDSRYLY